MYSVTLRGPVPIPPSHLEEDSVDSISKEGKEAKVSWSSKHVYRCRTRDPKVAGRNE